ncbi:MAG: AraC family transcriptional regulator [Beijerinckiaceae bacterium]|nr:AraC family transcriptional regulator [Beijerinckiaceae bacterium]
MIPFRPKPREKFGVVIAQTSSSRVDEWKTLRATSSLDDAAILYIARRSAGHGMTDEQGRKPGYSACIHLSECRSYDVWCNDRLQACEPAQAGTLQIHDMRHSWLADIRSSFEVMNFYISQAALDEVTDDQRTRRVEELRCPADATQHDAVLANLALALRPALNAPQQASKLFVDYAWRAVAAHLARTYGQHSGGACTARGGLAPWQERRVKEMLLADLSGNLTMTDMADACRLSCSHFSQVFRQSFGCTPHQWLLSQRVERSKQLILNTRQALSEIALATGFADQSHFTRVFTRCVKASPAAWRRAQQR